MWRGSPAAIFSPPPCRSRLWWRSLHRAYPASSTTPPDCKRTTVINRKAVERCRAILSLGAHLLCFLVLLEGPPPSIVRDSSHTLTPRPTYSTGASCPGPYSPCRASAHKTRDYTYISEVLGCVPVHLLGHNGTCFFLGVLGACSSSDTSDSLLE